VPSYFDTSALAKLILVEDGTTDAFALWDATDRVLTSLLTYPEIRSAMSAALRDGRVARARYAEVRAELDAYWERLHAAELSEPLAEVAGDLADLYGLSGADAVQVATALAMGGPDVIFVTWDRKLADAAHDLGLIVSPPS
jgi:hypothetical protein